MGHCWEISVPYVIRHCVEISVTAKLYVGKVCGDQCIYQKQRKHLMGVSLSQWACHLTLMQIQFLVNIICKKNQDFPIYLCRRSELSECSCLCSFHLNEFVKHHWLKTDGIWVCSPLIDDCGML